MKLRIIFQAVYFVNKNPSKERVQVLLSENELRELTDNSPKIFKESNIDSYLERQSPTFCNGKYNILGDFCHAEFSAYYALENKSSRLVNISQMNWMII